MLTLLLIGLLTLQFSIRPAKSEPRTIIVPDGYPTIQEGINAANSTDTIFVRSGTYYEHLVINKTVSLIGENRDTTIIDGGGNTAYNPYEYGDVVQVVADRVNIAEFTIRNSKQNGIHLIHANNSNVSFNNLVNNFVGIQLDYSSHNVILSNNASLNNNHGIELFESSDNNIIAENDISSNLDGIEILHSSNNIISQNRFFSNRGDGILLYASGGVTRNNTINNNDFSYNAHGVALYYSGASNNRIFHNNFINNIAQAFSSEATNIWDIDYPYGGNHWSDYIGGDSDGDGIGDTPYIIDANNLDHYPLMNPYGSPAESRTWTVDDDGPADFPTIQEAVDAARPGDTIFVRNGTYTEEQVSIKKSLKLIGENKNATVVDGAQSWVCVYVKSASDVRISGFTIQNGYGIYLYRSRNVIVSGNIIANNGQGVVVLESTNSVIGNNIVTMNGAISILLSSSSENKICENTVISNRGDAIWLENSTANTINDNIVSRNGLNTTEGFHAYGIRLSYSHNNTIYHNDVVENLEQADGWMSTNNTWDNGYPSGGNYWSDYTGVDANGDGIGDTPYIIDENNQDKYPIIHPRRYVPSSLQSRVLSIKLSGEHDYEANENAKIRLVALVKDAKTTEPVSDASVTVEIYGPDGNLWLFGVMVERVPGSGIYEWESNATIYELIQRHQLEEGVNLVYVKASVDRGLVATNMLQCHIDPLLEDSTSLTPLLYYAIATILIIAGTTTIVIAQLRRYRRNRDNPLIRQSLTTTINHKLRQRDLFFTFSPNH